MVKNTNVVSFQLTSVGSSGVGRCRTVYHAMLLGFETILHIFWLPLGDCFQNYFNFLWEIIDLIALPARTFLDSFEEREIKVSKCYHHSTFMVWEVEFLIV